MPPLVAPRTLPELFASADLRFPGGEHGRYYEDGVLRGIGWQPLSILVNRLTWGLMRLGVEPGERVAILARSSYLWTAVDQAILATGAITVGLHPGTPPAEIRRMLSEAGVRTLMVETPALAGELLDAATAPACVERILAMRTPEGEVVTTEPPTASLMDLVDAERADSPDGRRAVSARANAVKPEHVAALVYTAGTTSRPLAVVLTHAQLMEGARTTAALFPMSPADLTLTYAPLANLWERVFLYATLLSGARNVYLESPEQLDAALLEVGPTVLTGTPAVFERLGARLVRSVESTRGRRRHRLNWGLRVGRHHAATLRAGAPITPWLAAEHAMADRLALRRLRETLGGKLRLLLTHGAAISIDTLTLFHSVGLLVLEGYSLSESTSPITVNRQDAFRFGTAGLTAPGCELKLDDGGEILVSGPGLGLGYYERPEETEAKFLEDKDGRRWVRTGDRGDVDIDGFLRVLGRRATTLVTAQGTTIAPEPIESRLRAQPLVESACIMGQGKRYLIALFTLDRENATAWAKTRGLPTHDIGALAGSPALLDAIDSHVSAVNRELPRHEAIKRFAVLPDTFTLASGLITPSLTLNRRAIEHEYAELIEALY